MGDLKILPKNFRGKKKFPLRRGNWKEVPKKKVGVKGGKILEFTQENLGRVPSYKKGLRQVKKVSLQDLKGRTRIENIRPGDIGKIWKQEPFWPHKKKLYSKIYPMALINMDELRQLFQRQKSLEVILRSLLQRLVLEIAMLIEQFLQLYKIKYLQIDL